MTYITDTKLDFLRCGSKCIYSPDNLWDSALLFLRNDEAS